MTLRDKIADIIVADRPDTPQEALNPEEHADGFTPFWGYVVGFDKYADLSARVAELEAERDKLRLQHGNLINDTVSMGMAKDEAEARAEAAEAIVEQLTNNPDYLTVYRKGFEDGKAKLAEVQTMSEAPETM